MYLRDSCGGERRFSKGRRGVGQVGGMGVCVRVEGGGEVGRGGWNAAVRWGWIRGPFCGWGGVCGCRGAGFRGG